MPSYPGNIIAPVSDSGVNYRERVNQNRKPILNLLKRFFILMIPTSGKYKGKVLNLRKIR